LGQQTLVGSSIASPPGCVGGKCPVPVKASISGVVEIGSAGPCTMARLTDGKYWAWGSGESGMLGNGSTKDTLEPVEVKGLKAP
jgi:alpha-tubulin suppressor-like RCC1 family protein